LLTGNRLIRTPDEEPVRLVELRVLLSGCTERDEIEVQLEGINSHLLLSVLDPGRVGT
jgi:hypothetical protein